MRASCHFSLCFWINAVSWRADSLISSNSLIWCSLLIYASFKSKPTSWAILNVWISNSIGKIGSLPNTSWYGEYPVVFLHVVRYAHRAFGNRVAQSRLCDATVFVSIASITLLYWYFLPSHLPVGGMELWFCAWYDDFLMSWQSYGL